jgi:microsomal dipeptidase-like Zn-dependent dipeptidase
VSPKENIMEMLYNSDNYAVVHFEVAGDHVPARPTLAGLTRGGYEIVDKASKREIYLDGALAEHFKRGVEDLISTEPSEDDIDSFLSGYAVLAQQPVVLH